jgi:hypothetical protein
MTAPNEHVEESWGTHPDDLASSWLAPPSTDQRGAAAGHIGAGDVTFPEPGALSGGGNPNRHQEAVREPGTG